MHIVVQVQLHSSFAVIGFYLSLQSLRNVLDFSQLKLVALFSLGGNTIYYDLYSLDWDLSFGIQACLE